MVTLETLGWTLVLDDGFRSGPWKDLEPARVAIEDRQHYRIFAASGELSAHVSGRLLHETRLASDLPKVGDWVAVAVLPNEDRAVIHGVLPRRTKLSRKIPGRLTEEQILVANIDVAFIVQALDGSFNARRLERYLVMVLEEGVQPVVVLNKLDVGDDIPRKIAEARARSGATPVIAVSAVTGQGMEAVVGFIRPGLTLALIGASGVGKSTLINQIVGEEIQATTEVRSPDGKGRHTTSWRELIILPNGGLIIDTPGLRELQLWSADSGLDEAFADIDALAVRCHFRDCTHTVEKRCAVLDTLASGGLASDRYQSYLKLRREAADLAGSQNQRSYLRKKRDDKRAQRVFNKFKRRPNR